MRIFKERPIFGWGPENFSIALEKHYLPQFEVWYDRAHNVFFDYLTQTGILGLLSYLGIFATFYWQFFSKTRLNAKQKLLEANKQGKGKSPITNYQSLIFNSLLFALPVAYLVQGIVLLKFCRSISASLCFWLSRIINFQSQFKLIFLCLNRADSQ